MHDKPPQSTSVSSASLTPSLQWAETHLPLPSQTVPLLSLQLVPLAAKLAATHALLTQATVAHAVGLAWQSPVDTHGRQAPLPSQTLPPLSEQLVSAAAFITLHTPAEHTGKRHAVPVLGQSLSCTHPTHLPFPSQTVPPLSLHEVPMAALLWPQAPCGLHVGVEQLVPVGGQLAGLRHATQLPLPSHRVPPDVLHMSPAARCVVPQQPLWHAATAQSPTGGGQFDAAAQAVHEPPVPVLEVPEPVDIAVLELLDATVLPPTPPKSNPPRMLVHAEARKTNNRAAGPAYRALFMDVAPRAGRNARDSQDAGSVHKLGRKRRGDLLERPELDLEQEAVPHRHWAAECFNDASRAWCASRAGHGPAWCLRRPWRRR
jgi:hypothetical protein